jgi:LacI family gluconate utilization system Gnt-I transcriptional repressor
VGEEKRLVEAFVSHRVDGLVLTGRDHLPETERLIRRTGIPTVEVFEHIPEPIDLNVGSPQWDAGHALGAYLISRGRRRLAFIGHSDFNDRRIAARRDGLAAACAERRAPEPRLFATAGRPGSGDGGGEILGLILRDFPEVEAAVFAGHQIAVGAIHFATSVGISVPERIAVAGFGDSPVARWIRPRLTTVDFPVVTMGQAAGRLLVARMAGEPVPSPVLRMGFEILARESA